MTNWKHSFPGTKNTSNLFICMTDTKQYQLIFENWRRYNSSTIDEVTVQAWTGSVADPSDPLQRWDPKTVRPVPNKTSKADISVGSEADELMGAVKVLGLIGAVGGAEGVAKSFSKAVTDGLAWIMKNPIKSLVGATVGATALGAAVAKILGVSMGVAAKLVPAAVVAAVSFKVYDLWEKAQPAIAKKQRDYPGANAFTKGRAGWVSSGFLSEFDHWPEEFKAKFCKKNPGHKLCKTYVPGAVSGATGPTEHTDKDVDALMRMLKAETSWARSTPEMSAIIQVAINRKAAKGRKDFLSVVAPRTSGWNNASKSYARNFNNAHNYYGTPRAKKARQLIVDILKSGSSTGDLGGAQNWLHPHGMPKTDRPSKEIWTVTRPSGKKSTYISHDFGGKLGKRRLPLWAVHVSDGGSSKSMPTFVGRMLYSNGGGRSSKPSMTTVVVKSNKGDASKVIGIGDSITAGRNSWIDRIGGKKLAHDRWSSTKIRNNIFNKYIITEKGEVVNKPKTLVIFAGVNNQGNPDQVIKDLGYMAGKAQENGIDVKLVKLLPSARWWKDDARKLALKNIEKINNWISNEKWKTRAGSGAVETASMSDSKGVLRNSKDGLHPNRKGQQELASLIGDAIKA